MKITLSKAQWEMIGAKTGWIKKAHWNEESSDSIIGYNEAPDMSETVENLLTDMNINENDPIYSEKFKNMTEAMEQEWYKEVHKIEQNLKNKPNELREARKSFRYIGSDKIGNTIYYFSLWNAANGGKLNDESRFL
jgi:hypothetical protein